MNKLKHQLILNWTLLSKHLASDFYDDMHTARFITTNENPYRTTDVEGGPLTTKLIEATSAAATSVTRKELVVYYVTLLLRNQAEQLKSAPHWLAVSSNVIPQTGCVPESLRPCIVSHNSWLSVCSSWTNTNTWLLKLVFPWEWNALKLYTYRDFP